MSDFSPNIDGLWPLLERSFEGVLIAEPKPWRVKYSNSSAADWLEAASAELVGRPIQTIFNDSSRDAVFRRLDETLNGNSNDEPLLAALLSPRSDATIVSIRCCRVILDGAVLVGILMDDLVTTQRDPLTVFLPDRNYLYSRLFALLDGSTGDSRFAVLFIDLDNFKTVNDRHGHLVGDRVLFEAAKRLVVCVGKTNHVVRYGGDEFVVLVDHVSDARELQALAERIRDAIAPPIAVPDGEVRLSASVGIAIRSPEYRTPNEILAAADRAMYAAKRASV